MKEAAGEANMTVITIALIAIVLAVGGVIVKNVMDNSKKSSCCTSDGGYWTGGVCYPANTCTTGNDGKTTCTGAPFTPAC